MSIFKSLFFTGLFGFVLSSSFSFASETFKSEKERNAPFLIETGWLSSNINNPDIVLIDAREEGKHNDEYLPNATKVDINETYGKFLKKNVVAPILELQKIMSNAGIDKTKHVIVYDSGELKFAARIFWILEFLGHDRVSLLNGGLDKWKKESLPLAKAARADAKPLKFVVNLRPQYHSSRSSVYASIKNPDMTIIDSRSVEEYSGKKSKTKKLGHIPSSINIPLSDYFEKKEGYQVVDLVKFNNREAKLSKNKKALAYCNSGKDSALTFLVLRSSGYEVSLYDGAWSDWSEDESLPVSTKVEK